MMYAHSAQCIIILVLQPGSNLDWPIDVYPLHSFCCLGFPVVSSRHLFLLGEQFSFHPACISWGFVTGVVLHGEGSSFISNHRRVVQASTFPPETGWPSCALGHWVSILVTSLTHMDCVGAVLFLATTWELHNVYHWCKN